MRHILSALALGVWVFTAAPAPAQQVADHLKCYKVKDPLKLGGTADLNTPQFGTDAGCTVSKAKLFCVPATKTNVAVTDKDTGNPITPLPVSAGPADGDRICYKVKCPNLPADQPVTDQFGTRTLSKLKASLLCTPAVKGTAFCGDGTIGAGEDCEGSNLGGATCQSLGFESGTLACGPGCSFDTSGCACVTGGGGGFPATGQTTCWNSSGVVIPCAGTGQDGDIQAGATLAYMDNGDGTITDLNTGLMWEKKSDDGTIHDKDTVYTWDNAFAVHIAGLNTANFAGHNDWRVPNLKELQSIVNYETVADGITPVVSSAFNTGCAPGCAVTACSCTPPGNFWSSTAYSNTPSNAWGVSFFIGLLFNGPKGSTSFRVHAVRGGL